MKAAQKLRLTIENIEIETTFSKLPERLKFLAEKLEKEQDGLPVHSVVQDGGGRDLFVALAWIGKPQIKRKVFGYDADEFMAKQYK